MLRDFTKRVPTPLLFRYLSEKTALLFLNDPHLRFSNPASFNDPFEFRPELKIKLRGADFAELLAHNELSPSTSVQEAQRILAQRVHNEACNRYHVLCFTEDPLNLLMWAHYAESHTGCAFGFDSDLFVPFREIGLTAGPVIYDDKRPVLELPEQVNLKGTIKAIFTKGTAWSYEREWRLAIKGDGTNKPEREMSFDPNLLRVIIAGARCTDAKFTAIRNALSANSRLKHVELVRAGTHEHGFNLKLKRRNGAPFSLEHFTENFVKLRHRRREHGHTWYAEGMRKRAAKGLPISSDT